MNRVTLVTAKTAEARRWYIFEWSKKEKTEKKNSYKIYFIFNFLNCKNGITKLKEGKI